MWDKIWAKRTSAVLAYPDCLAAIRTNQAPEMIIWIKSWCTVFLKNKKIELHNDGMNYHKKRHVDHCNDSVKKGGHTA